MPELTPNKAWPPEPWGIAYDTWRENEAWWTGDVERLAWIYGNAHGDRAVRATHSVGGVNHRGGIVGAIRSAFWGRPEPLDERRIKLHIPAPADIATLSSDLLFAEPPEIGYDDDAAVSDLQRGRIAEIMESDAARSWQAEAGEMVSAFGAVALTTVWDEETADHVWVQPSGADVCLPEFRYGKLVALNLWTEYRPDMHVVYRHVERHAPGRIEHTLYRGTRENLGMVVPLQELEATDPYAELVDKDGGLDTGIDRLTASWWINAPARQWRRRGALGYAGRSDYAGGVKGLFDALDEAWSSWMRDLDLGRARLIVPDAYLEQHGRGHGASFDSDRSIYSPLSVPGDASGGMAESISEVQFQIRVQEHEQTTQAIYRRILAAAGFGELDKETASATDRTATEINVGSQSRERTRDRKSLYARQALSDVARTAMLLDGVKFPGKGGGDLGPVSIAFPPASQQDTLKVAQTIASLRAAQAASIETAVRMAHPDWTDQQVQDEVADIQSERQIADPTQVGAVNPSPDEEAAARDALGLPPADDDDEGNDEDAAADRLRSGTA